jgi:peptide deformylase
MTNLHVARHELEVPRFEFLPAFDERLRQISEPVDLAEIGSPAMDGLVDSMIEAAIREDGVGCSAPQGGVFKRVVVWDRNYGNKDASEQDFQPLYNPEITWRSDTIVYWWEGCLSTGDLTAYVPRWEKVRIRGLNRLGEMEENLHEGRQADVGQHELEHLDGLLIVDKPLNPKSMKNVPPDKLEKIWQNFTTDEQKLEYEDLFDMETVEDWRRTQPRPFASL